MGIATDAKTDIEERIETLERRVIDLELVLLLLCYAGVLETDEGADGEGGFCLGPVLVALREFMGLPRELVAEGR